MNKLTEEQLKEELRKPLGYISKWLIQLRRECSKAQGYTPGEKQVVHMNLSKIQTELEVAKLILKEDCFPLISSLLQKEREAGKREGIEILEGAKLPYEHYWPRAKQEQRLCETCNEVVERYTPCKASKHYPCWQALNSVIEKLKSVEKSNSLQEKLEIDDFKFDKKGNSIP